MIVCREQETSLVEISAIFWDIGGVLLNNAWDREERRRAVEQFQLDAADFDKQHASVISSFERGEIGLDEYLHKTVFDRPRDFSKEAFKAFMFSLSHPNLEALELARQLASSRRYLMATINNESTELNRYRIRSFGLREIFSLFVSSCFVGLLKPEAEIYRLALSLTQKAPEECIFIDDRAPNLEPASQLGMNVIQMQNVKEVRLQLERFGVAI